jgi:molybdate transport system substrate-binding protein
MLTKAGRLWGEQFTASVRAHIVSEEHNVRLVRAKVALGEADAAIVYRTDVPPDDSLNTLPIPAEVNVHASYCIAVLSHSEQAALAESFEQYVLSTRGQANLKKHGYRGKEAAQ